MKCLVFSFKKSLHILCQNGLYEWVLSSSHMFIGSDFLMGGEKTFKYSVSYLESEIYMRHVTS